MKARLMSAALAATMLTAAPAVADSYDLQSVFGLQVPSIGPSPVKWAERVKLMTNGEIDIKVHPPDRNSKLDLKYGSMALFQADSSGLQCYNSARPPGDHPVTSWASAAA